jgi:hypothetical protein
VNHGSFDATGVSQVMTLSVTSCATTVAPTDLDIEASWKTVLSSTLFSATSPLRTSLIPKPFAYTAFPPRTIATAIPGMPVSLISAPTKPSTLEMA